MNVTRKIKPWFKRHWSILLNRPVNGHASMEDIDRALVEIEGSTRRVCESVKKIVADTQAAQRIAEQDVSNFDNS